MSETVNYTLRVNASAGRSLKEVLSQFGIRLHDAQAWQRARQKVMTMQKSLGAADCSSIRHLPAEKGQNALSVDQAITAMQDDYVLRRLMQSVPDMDSANLGKDPAGLIRRLNRVTANIEQRVGQSSLERSLDKLGYVVEHHGEQLRATRGQTCLWAHFDRDVGLHLDLSGFSGLSCIQEIGRIEADLKQHGITLNRRRVSPHAIADNQARVNGKSPFVCLPISPGQSSQIKTKPNKVAQ